MHVFSSHDTSFEQAQRRHQDIIFNWLDKPHVKEFWDNSPEHREDIRLFLRGQQQPFPYFSYWLGSMYGEPYCFLLTSEFTGNQDMTPLHRENLSKTGKTFGIDFCIGNEKFLGRGHAASTVQAFTEFFHREVDQAADTFFIDPNEDNPRARRVYEKAGFMPVGNFVMEGGFFHGHESMLMVKKLKPYTRTPQR